MADKEQNAQAVSDEVSALAQQTGKTQEISLPNFLLILTQRFARLAKMDQEEFKIRMLAMKNSMPSLYQEIYNNPPEQV